ncbi:MAG: HAMP domain-containing histidine kinase [Halobacteriovoraceae bacterium]|nr:HAMP domain-containing histidine kinase [Halobacteriovoraceae bacterium]
MSEDLELHFFREQFEMFRLKFLSRFAVILLLSNLIILSQEIYENNIPLIVTLSLSLFVFSYLTFILYKQKKIDAFSFGVASTMTLIYAVCFYLRGGISYTPSAWFPTFIVFYFLLIPYKRPLYILITSLVVVSIAIEISFVGGFFERPIYSTEVSYRVNLVAIIVTSLFNLMAFYHLFSNLKLYLKHIYDNFEYKQVLLSVLYHDIATPLTTIMLNLYRKQEDRKCQKAYMAANDIKTIIENVRSFEKITMGKVKSDFKHVDMKEVFNELKESFQDRLNAKNIVLNLNAFQRYPKVWGYGDFSILKNSVFANILSNAIKFSPEGQEISVDFEEGDSGELKVVVADQGIGVPDEIKESIFRFKSKSSRLGTSNEEGNGFGLPIVKKYLEYFNGDIRVENNNPGTRMVITLRTKYDFSFEETNDLAS